MAQLILSDRLLNLHAKIYRLQEETRNRLKIAIPVGSTVIYKTAHPTVVVSGVVIGHPTWDSIAVKFPEGLQVLKPFITDFTVVKPKKEKNHGQR